jgi:hypothetical protein
MAWTREQIERAWRRTDGRCHLTGRAIRLSDYGVTWEMEHSIPRANGGTDHGNNLFPALISPNRSKQGCSTRSVRAAYGLPRAPLSRREKDQIRNSNALKGAGVFAVAGGALFGPLGALGGAVLGALVGDSDPVRTPRINRTKKRR